MTELLTIRPFQRRDSQAVREVCVEAGWRGRSARQFLENPGLWADFWTGDSLTCEPENCWVVCDPAGRVCGYLTGCADSESAGRFLAWRVLPGVAARALVAGQWRSAKNRRFFARTIRAARRGQVGVPRQVRREHPGHFHFNLLPRGRGQGIGRRLYELFEGRMRKLGVAGLHSQVLGANPVVNGFLLRRGFAAVQRHRVPSLEGYVEPGPVELTLYVKRLHA